MNREKIIEIFLEYFKTILLTLIVSFVIILGLLKMVQYNIYQDFIVKQQKAQNEPLDYGSLSILIEKNKASCFH